MNIPGINDIVKADIIKELTELAENITDLCTKINTNVYYFPDNQKAQVSNSLTQLTSQYRNLLYLALPTSAE